MPVGFLVVGQGNIRFIQVDGNAATLHRLIDLAPQVLQYIQNWLRKEPLPGANNPTTGHGTLPNASYGPTASPYIRPSEAGRPDGNS